MLYPPTIIFGTKPPELRLRQRGGTQIYFCTRNGNLHLTETDFVGGTYEMGRLLGVLCAKYCSPGRTGTETPCPTWTASHMVGTENKGLATVEMRPLPDWEACAGVKRLLDVCQTDEERLLLKAYLEDKVADETQWRDRLVTEWNENWWYVPNGWGAQSRRSKFGSMLWQTLRFPALIPQVWLNWLSNASEADMKLLDENPSRVDFLAFWKNERHVIEIDGPSHYASFDAATREYTVDESMYARNLKIERSLRGDGWVMTRIGRQEVRESRDDFFGAMGLLEILPFYKDEYPAEMDWGQLGAPEITARLWAEAEIPF